MSNTLSKNQKRPFVPRVKSENEAPPITFVQSQLIAIPKMIQTRQGADDHLAVKRVGVRC